MYAQDPIGTTTSTSLSSAHVTVAPRIPTPPTASAAPSAAPTEVRASNGLLRFARGFYFGGLAALLILFSPIAWVPAVLLKLVVFLVCLTISVICFSASGEMPQFLRSRSRLWWGLTVLALPVVYVISWRFSIDHASGLIGSGGDVDTVLFMVIAFVTFVMGSTLMRSMESSRNFLRTIGAVAGVAVLFQLFEIFVGSHVFAVLGNPAFNFIGKWNDFGVIAALAAILAFARLELFANSTRQKVALWVGLVISALLLAIVNFNVAWWIVLSAAVLVFAFQFAGRRSQTEMPHLQYGMVAMAVVSVIFLLAGSTINGHLPGFLSVPSLEIRPALSTTFQLAQDSHTSFGRTLIGAGPDTFVNTWLAHKPLSVNETQFWGIDFASGFSTVATAYESVGLLGVIAWLLPLLGMIWGLWRLLRSMNFTPERKQAAVLGIVAALLWIVMFAYTSGQDVVLLTFATAGAFTAALASQVPLVISRGVRVLGTLAAVVLVVLSIFLTGSLGRRFGSVAYAQQASIALQNSDITSAASLDQKSESIERTGDNARLGLVIDESALQKLLAASSSPLTQDAMRTQFQNLVANAVNDQGQMALTLQPNNYQSYAALASVYDMLVPLKVSGAYEKSQEMYQKAMALNPTNPTLPLLLARTEATQDPSGNLDDIQKLVDHSLALKSNYTDALLFNEQLAVARNDLPGATKAAAQAAASAPDQAPLWFELGLYYYTAQDWKDAGAALAQAVTIEPDYANAKYFLGLTYYQLKDSQDALKQFQDLEKTNPDNTSVKSIIANLTAGKDPFNGAPSASSTPQKAKHAPVKE